MRTVQRDTNWCIAIVSAMICKWCRSTVVKKELSMDMKLSIYRSTYVPTLTNYYQLADTSGRNQLPPKSISALPLRHVEEVDCSGGAEIKAANPPHWNEPGKGMPDVHFLRWGKVLSGNGLGIDPGHIRARCWVRELINYSSQYTLLLSLHSYKRGRQEVRNNRGGKKKKKRLHKNQIHKTRCYGSLFMCHRHSNELPVCYTQKAAKILTVKNNKRKYIVNKIASVVTEVLIYITTQSYSMPLNCPIFILKNQTPHFCQDPEPNL